jgi:hypothetical protein
MLPHRWTRLLGLLVNLDFLGDLINWLRDWYGRLLLDLLVKDDIGILAGAHLEYLFFNKFEAGALACKV